MSKRFLEPSSAGLRQPTDNSKDNGHIVNPPRYAEMGGLDKASKTKTTNQFRITKPGGR